MVPADTIYQTFPIYLPREEGPGAPMVVEDRLSVTIGNDGPQLTDFCISQQRLIDGLWLDVVRYDCAHGSIHAHYFRSDGSEIRKRDVKKIENFADIREGYDRAYKSLMAKWVENARRF